METIFMNAENSKENKTHRFRLKLSDNLNLKDLNKNIMANLSIHYTWHGKILNLHTKIINLKYLLQLGILNLICLMDNS